MPTAKSKSSAHVDRLLDRFAALAVHQHLRDLAPTTLNDIVDLAGAQAGYLLLLRDGEQTLSLEAAVGGGSAPGEWRASAAVTRELAALDRPVLLDTHAASSLASFEMLPRGRANLLVPLRMHGRLIALVALLVEESPSAQAMALLSRLAGFAAGILISSIREQELAESLDAFCHALGKTVDARTRADDTHSERVAAYCAMTAAQLGWHPEEVETARRAGYLHDLGKLSVPDAVLHKPGRLTDDEYALMRRSVDWATSVVEGVPSLRAVAPMMRHQGERFAGGGYPDGLQGQEIPAGARLLAVTHRFAVAFMPRADRGPLVRMRQVLGILESESGASLDPRMVEAFMEALGQTK